MDELDALKYQIYKKSKKADYITFKQFKENQKVINRKEMIPCPKNQKANF